MPSHHTTVTAEAKVISNIDKLMRRSDKTTPSSVESLFKASLTSTERDLRKPEMPAPIVHLWTPTGYRFFQAERDGFSISLESQAGLWGRTLPAMVADLRATRFAYGQVIFLPASSYRPDAEAATEEGYGSFIAVVSAMDGRGSCRHATCGLLPQPDNSGLRRHSDWYASSASVDELGGAFGHTQAVVDALRRQEQPVAVPGLVEVTA